MVPVRGVVDLAEPAAERHLRFADRGPRSGNTSTPLSSSASSTASPSRSSPASRSESTPRTSAPTESVSLLIVSRLMSFRHGTGSPMRSMTASAESVGFWVPKTSTAIETMIIE